MIVLGLEVIESAQQKHADLRKPLAAWLSVVRTSAWEHLTEARGTWANTDSADGKTIFNIKGKKYRLTAIINYESQVLIVRKVETHAEYGG